MIRTEPLQSFRHIDRCFELRVSSLLQCFSREFNRKLRHDAIVLHHPSLPRQEGSNRQAKNVSWPTLYALPLSRRPGVFVPTMAARLFSSANAETISPALAVCSFTNSTTRLWNRR